MLRLGLGALAAAFLMFMWGFVFWASGLIDPASHMSAEGETAIADALRTHTPNHGLYFVPDSKNGTEAEAAARMAQGPFAMIYVKPSGATMGDPAVLGLGFGHMFLTAILIGLILTWVLPATPSWSARFKLVALIGATATIFGVLGHPIWWHHAWGTSLIFAVFDFVAYLLAGAVMAWTVRP
jgi:hypothetical protein